MVKKHIVIGSRRSDLALWQTNHVIDLLKQSHSDLTAEIKIISTKGDEIIDKPLPEIGGKGLFTEALENALRAGDIDLAVHSLKDLPTEDPEGIIIGAIPERADMRDVLVSREKYTLDNLPEGATVGTSSRRRQAQLLAYRDDLTVIDIRGNVPTRIRKAKDENSSYDAIVLAKAGVERLGLAEHIAEILPLDVMLPAPGQGALGIQCRDDAESQELLAPLYHHETLWTVTAERAFLNALGGGCSVPVAALATFENGVLSLQGRVAAVDGTTIVAVDGSTDANLNSASELGRELARQAKAQGAAAILEAVQ